MVEADISGHESPFAGLERSHPADRLDEAQLAELTRVAMKTGVSLSMLDTSAALADCHDITGDAGAASGSARVITVLITSC